MTQAIEKVALVTGAAGGIGRALAVGFSEAGYDVAITDLKSQLDGLRETQAAIEQNGRVAYVQTMDVSNKKDVNLAVERVLSEAKHIDVLINNAGILRPSTLDVLSEEDFDATMNINVKGVLFCCQAVLPSMQTRRSGSIINIASTAARQGRPTQGHYAASKASVVTLTRVLAQEVGTFGIRVNAICPGVIVTEMGRKVLGSEEEQRYWISIAALRRLGEPQDLIGPALFLSSEQSAYVTGQTLNVCGGHRFD